MEKMKQNKNTSVLFSVGTVILSIVIILCTFAIPAYAVTDPPSTNSIDFTNQPLPYIQNASYNADTYNQALLAAELSNGTSQALYISSNTNVDVYAFKVSYNYYFASAESHFLCAYVSKDGDSYTGETRSSRYTNSTFDLYYDSIGIYNGGLVTNIYIPEYSTSNEGFEAVRNYIDNGGAGGSTVAEFNYSIKPGYALFIDIHGLSDVQGTLFTNTSAAFASPHTSNQTLSYQSSLPGGSVSPQGNGINWQGTGNRDLFGRYKSWNCTMIIQPNKNYIAIYNPVHINTYVDPEHEDYNGNISVHVNKAYSDSSILIPLNTELTGTGTVGTNTTDEEKPLVYDPNTDSWTPTNQDGTPYTESPYGDYLPSTMNSIHDWLQNIANLISGFFNGAIGAVTTLVGAGSAFINQLVSLYSWLPAPVYAVLSSALILVITIGVIKVFI